MTIVTPQVDSNHALCRIETTSEALKTNFLFIKYFRKLEKQRLKELKDQEQKDQEAARNTFPCETKNSI